MHFISYLAKVLFLSFFLSFFLSPSVADLMLENSDLRYPSPWLFSSAVALFSYGNICTPFPIWRFAMELFCLLLRLRLLLLLSLVRQRDQGKERVIQLEGRHWGVGRGKEREESACARATERHGVGEKKKVKQDGGISFCGYVWFLNSDYLFLGLLSALADFSDLHIWREEVGVISDTERLGV